MGNPNVRDRYSADFPGEDPEINKGPSGQQTPQV
jgi:hypothetical protein